MNNLAFTNQSELTMSSLEIADLVNSRHDNVRKTIERLVNRGVVTLPAMEEKPTGGRPSVIYHVTKRDSYVVVAQLCPEFTAKLVDRWQELENQIFLPQNLPDALRLAADLAEENQVLAIENQKQNVKIDALENFFQGGMTIPAFGKMLNGVNSAKMNDFVMNELEWVFNASRSGKSRRFRAYSKARDRFIREVPIAIAVHGQPELDLKTLLLLKKGVKKLYSLYLNNQLPMKKSWDGQFTHENQLVEVAA